MRTSAVAVDGPAVVCRDLVRIFREDRVEVQALQGLNLSVDSGRLVAIVGESGSGKSTLLSILAGLDTPTAGSASVCGHNLLSMTRRERLAYRRHVVGLVWQETARNLVPYLTAAQNIAVVHAGRGRAEHATRAAELLGLLGVAECADRRLDEMSGGQAQRVSIAVALTNRPQVLLADEPTGALDEATAADVLESLRAVTTQLGVTTVIVTHDPAVADHVERTIRIRDGRTSTEVLRRTTVDSAGDSTTVAEEFAVLDGVGRLQLPGDFIDRLELADRVRLALEPDHIGVWHPGAAAPESGDAAPGSGNPG